MIFAREATHEGFLYRVIRLLHAVKQLKFDAPLFQPVLVCTNNDAVVPACEMLKLLLASPSPVGTTAVYRVDSFVEIYPNVKKSGSPTQFQ